MSIFEWLVLILIVAPVGVFLWLCFVLLLVNLPSYLRTVTATARLARMKPVEPKAK